MPVELTETEKKVLFFLPDPPATFDLNEAKVKAGANGEATKLLSKGIMSFASAPDHYVLTGVGVTTRVELVIGKLTEAEKAAILLFPDPPGTDNACVIYGKMDGKCGLFSLGVAEGDISKASLTPTGFAVKKILMGNPEPKKISSLGNLFPSASIVACTCQGQGFYGPKMKAKCPLHGTQSPPGWKSKAVASVNMQCGEAQPHPHPKTWKLAPELIVEAVIDNDHTNCREIQILSMPEFFQYLSLDLDLGELLGMHEHYLGSRITSIVVTGSLMVRFYLTCPFQPANALQVMKESLEGSVASFTELHSL